MTTSTPLQIRHTVLSPSSIIPASTSIFVSGSGKSIHENIECYALRDAESNKLIRECMVRFTVMRVPPFTVFCVNPIV